MGFCYNCGIHLDEDDRFCPKCGAQQKDVAIQSVVTKDAEATERVYAYLFTNLKLLAYKLGMSVKELYSVLDEYIVMRGLCGVSYELLDASGYQASLSMNQGFLGSQEKLDPSDGWEAHQRFIMNRYFSDAQQGKIVEHLFIIGSDDIIPMPAVGRHSDDGTPFFTDFPYAYLYGDKTETLINDGIIYQQVQHLCVGRLPLPDDVTSEMLLVYMRNVQDVSSFGLDFSTVYGQCDPHWKRVTGSLTRELRNMGWFLNYDLPEEYCFRSLLLSPMVTSSNVDEVFNINSCIYLFNMHGDNHPGNNDYYGKSIAQPEQESITFSGITPRQFRSILHPNVVVSEACYGAKPNHRKHNESILLSSLTTKTVLFFGSTNIAWGCNDMKMPDGTYCEEPPLGCADVFARSVIYGLLNGCVAGEVLSLARWSVFQECGFRPQVIDTVLEFNLFGDPTLLLESDSQRKTLNAKVLPRYQMPMHWDVNRKMLFSTKKEVRMKVTEVYAQCGNSILSKVRTAVNRSVMDVNKVISEHLYKYYNLSPRRLERVLRVDYTQGESIYQYCYGDDSIKYVVTTDRNHRVKSVEISK